jgi:ParB family protein of integrating conjugative element (PFGI_1 class)
MPELTIKEMAARLRGEPFTRTESSIQAVGDPIGDTPMVVTLDELQPYDLNPRITRNPKYDEIKASIRERGLDAPPTITRRPGTSHFIIRNGGNTRLSILRELWTETRDERFFRISCVFRPWSARGEIVALTGHLAENELRGALSFIERALGVEKARELYEQELGQPLSQRELARRLTADGYPINHSLLSRMSDAVQHLLPAIPTILYAGLGRPQAERLTGLRKSGARVWEHHIPKVQPSVSFATLFQDVLASFDADPDAFDVQRVQDELVKQMAQLLASDYDTLSLELIDADGIRDALSRDPASQPSFSTPLLPAESAAPKLRSPTPQPSAASPPRPSPTARVQTSAPVRTTPQRGRTDDQADNSESDDSELEDAELDGAELGEETTSSRPAPQLPGAVVGTTPATNALEEIRANIAQLAGDLASEGSLRDSINVVDEGVGFICVSSWSDGLPSPFQVALLALLRAISAPELGSLSDAGVARVSELFKLTRRLSALAQGSSLSGFRSSDSSH